MLFDLLVTILISILKLSRGSLKNRICEFPPTAEFLISIVTREHATLFNSILDWLSDKPHNLIFYFNQSLKNDCISMAPNVVNSCTKS